jgi:hypothetical protein
MRACTTANNAIFETQQRIRPDSIIYQTSGSPDGSSTSFLYVHTIADHILELVVKFQMINQNYTTV